MNYEQAKKELKHKIKQQVTKYKWIDKLPKKDAALQILKWSKTQDTYKESIERNKYANTDFYKKVYALFNESWDEVGPPPIWLQHQQNKPPTSTQT